MAIRPDDLLSDDVRQRLARLDITAHTMVEGPLAGLHKSPYQGFSVEFAQHREYTWGDELKHLDWKVYARTDRYYVKQYEEETDLAALALLDASESMTYRGARAVAGKYEYGATLVAGLAFLFLRQQDAFGVTLFDRAAVASAPPSANPAQLRRLATMMSEVEVRGEGAEAPPLSSLAEVLPRRGLVFIVSDLLFPSQAFLDGVRHLRHRGHEVVVLHLLDPDELDLPFDDPIRFEGLEGQPQLLADPRALRDDYLRRLQAFQQQVEAGCQAARADYVFVNTAVAPGLTLARYLTQRRRRRRMARG